MSNELCHFELMVSDVDKAKVFYGKIFDWKFTGSDMPGYTMIDTGKEPGGGMMKKPDEVPGFALSVYYLVDSIDETLKKVADAGGCMLVPKMEIPTIGWWALFTDPDGIPVSIFESAA